MKFLIADTFRKSLTTLDAKSAGLVKQAAFDFQADPSLPSAQFHRIENAKDKSFWSFRVNLDLRVVVHKSEETLLLCYADHHDEAYAWALSRRIEVHPQTGAAQIVEVKERIEEIVRTVVREETAEAPIFAKFEVEYLLALGVPTEWIDAVRTVGEAGFAKVTDHLPAEAAERLLQLACGEPVPRPVATTVVGPFEHPDAQRRFVVMDSQDELRRALDYPWEQWIVFLHPTQRAVVTRKFAGPAKVTGSAGTGKSVVALHRAARLAREGRGEVLLTTFSKTLAARLGQAMDLLLPPTDTKRERVQIDHLHKLAHELWSEHSKLPFAPVDSKSLGGVIESAKSKVAPQSELSLPFLRAEWEAIVDPWGIREWSDYKTASRAGRATPLGARQRQIAWSIFAETQRILQATGRMTWSGLCHAVAEKLADKPPFAHVVADECQDFGPAELVLLRALAPSAKDDLFLCGDAGQRIYKGSFSWSQARIDIRGRSTRLRVNYRTTEQIRRFADAMLPSAIDEGDGENGKRTTVSLLHGVAPEVRAGASVVDEIRCIETWLRARFDEGFTPRDIALFGRTDAICRERIEPALARLNVTPHRLSDDRAPSTKEVAVGTMHRAKGLEFKVVVVAGCDADVLPSVRALQDIGDEADRDAAIEQERGLLYVACTRARERLLVTYARKGSRFLGAGA